jgi:hypothetical protein
MHSNNLEYAYNMTLLVKKDKSRCFCGDYRPLNLQIWRDAFPMPLIDNIFNQLDQFKYYSTLDLQSDFW